MPDSTSRLKEALEGRYRVERELGEGGMATVYLARDLKHERSVAVKVLNPELAAVVGAERFLAEIRTTANLQHPHILPLYDSGEADGCLFYVMPYVEGESLRDRLDRERQLPVDEAVTIAADMAEALDYAHRQGVVHRDIKPANVLLQHGKAVVSDFGVALALDVAGGTRLTETGLSLGTPYYMAPEQATGDQYVGPTADVYALGCVLFEMLAGEPPHTGSSPHAVLGKILTEPPPRVTRQRARVPAHVEAVIGTALEKIPSDRFQGASAFAAALADPSFGSGRAAAQSSNGPTRVAWPSFGAGALAALLAVVAWSAVGSGSRPTADAIVSRYPLGLAEPERMVPGFENSIALSPDGRRLVYVGPGDEGGAALWLKERDQLRSRRLSGTDGAITPFFAPDGTRIAFVRESDRSLHTLDLETTQRIELGQGLGLVGGSWGDDGHIYATDADSGAIVRYSATSGERSWVTALAEGERAHVRAEILPGGMGIVYQTWLEGDDPARLVLEDLGGGARTVLDEDIDPVRALYSPTGHLLVVDLTDNLRAAPFDAERVEVTGAFTIIEPGVATSYPLNDQGADIALSAEGTLVYLGRSIDEGLRAAWFDRSGAIEPIDFTWPSAIESIVLAPDGERFLAALGPPLGTEIWMASVDRPSAVAPFADVGDLTRRPVWFAGGDSVAFIGTGAVNRDAYVKAVAGADEPRVLLDLEADVDEIVVSPTGWLVYRTGTTTGDRDIYAVRRRAGAEPIAVAADPDIDETSPTLSPDGRYLAYVADGSLGRVQVWVRPFPEVSSGAWLVSSAEGRAASPRWSSDGTELFYTEDGSMMAAQISHEGGFEVLERRELFPMNQSETNYLNPNFGVHPDGQRFLMALRDAAYDLVLVENFGRELARLVPR